MERSKKYCLSLSVILLVLTACGSRETLYHRTYSDSDKVVMADQIMNGLSRYYQGSPHEVLLKREFIKLHPTDASIHREIGAPMVKRGLTQEFAQHYGRAVELKPQDWQGYRAYMYLYFYRDYVSALRDIEEYDPYTPDFVDYPQSTSVDYMRGICYYHLGDHERAYDYLQKHLQRERTDAGDRYVSTSDYVHTAVAAIAVERYDEGLAILDVAQSHTPMNAEISYYQAIIYDRLGDKSAAREALLTVKECLNKNYSISRPYVEEFFKVYIEDVEQLEDQL